MRARAAKMAHIVQALWQNCKKLKVAANTGPLPQSFGAKKQRCARRGRRPTTTNHDRRHGARRRGWRDTAKMGALAHRPLPLTLPARANALHAALSHTTTACPHMPRAHSQGHFAPAGLAALCHCLHHPRRVFASSEPSLAKSVGSVPFRSVPMPG